LEDWGSTSEWSSEGYASSDAGLVVNEREVQALKNQRRAERRKPSLLFDQIEAAMRKRIADMSINPPPGLSGKAPAPVWQRPHTAISVKKAEPKKDSLLQTDNRFQTLRKDRSLSPMSKERASV
jgi:hypothetical protein